MVRAQSLAHCDAHTLLIGRPGLLKIATSYFLISISDREQVAQIRGKPIYKITDVALIPLSSQADADKAIAATRDHLRRRNRAPGLEDDDTDSESDDGAPSVTDSVVEESPPAKNEVTDPVTGRKGSPHPQTSVAEDVIQRKGVYGRFADKWFSRKGWSADNRRMQGLSSDENLAAKNVPQNVDSVVPNEEEQPKSEAKPDAIPTGDKNVPESVSPEAIPKALGGEKDAATIALLPKILQTTKMYFSSGNFFFSYEYDISHGIGQQQPSSSVALFKQFDPLVSLYSTCVIQLLTLLVFLEPKHRLSLHRSWPTLLRPSHIARLRRPAAVYHQDCRRRVEQPSS